MISNYLMPVAVCPFTFSGCRGVAKRRHGSEWLPSFRRDRRPRLSVYIFGMSRRHPLQGNIHFRYSLFVWWVSLVFRTTNGRPYGEAIFSPITYHFSFSKPSHPLCGSSPKGRALKRKSNACDQQTPYSIPHTFL